MESRVHDTETGTRAPGAQTGCCKTRTKQGIGGHNDGLAYSPSRMFQEFGGAKGCGLKLQTENSHFVVRS